MPCIQIYSVSIPAGKNIYNMLYILMQITEQEVYNKSSYSFEKLIGKLCLVHSHFYQQKRILLLQQ